MKRAERFDAPMNSVLQDSSFARQPRFASVGTSILVHTAIVGLLLLVSGPVWTSAPPRTVTRLVLPAPVAPLALVLRKLPRHQSWKAATPALPEPGAEPAVRQKLLSPPVRAATQPVLRIELAPEMAPLTMPTLPAVSIPALTVRPALKVGMLNSPSAVAATAPRATTAIGGFDAGRAEAGRRNNVAGSIVGSGFDEPSSGRPAPSRHQLSNGGFDQAETPAAQSTVAKVVSTPFEGIEILEKPRPVYTDEARRLRIEGTVQLRVVFGAAGQIRVVAVVKGLGHGLDEAAVQAAEAIRFRPARRDGHPVDAPAVIQIQFQIA